jgi:hypothetical protein
VRIARQIVAAHISQQKRKSGLKIKLKRETKRPKELEWMGEGTAPHQLLDEEAVRSGEVLGPEGEQTELDRQCLSSHDVRVHTCGFVSYRIKQELFDRAIRALVCAYRKEERQRQREREVVDNDRT